MTETTVHTDRLPNALENFVLQWGELGGKWGVNRSVSQIHAYLYIADEPLTADQVADGLNMARSNVSNSIKELLNWNLVHRVPIRGDRRDHFEAETDIWEIAARIAAGRKSREIDPALRTLRDCVALAENDDRVSAESRRKLKNMLDFTEAADRWYDQMLSIPKSKRSALMKLGAKISSLLPPKKST
jgi:DNA-binding transcriptional regulator GbsR (MarR family)